MKKIVVRKDVDIIVIENDRYSPEVQCIDCGVVIDIGVEYIYLQYSEAVWFDNYYVDQSNRINQFTEDQVSTLCQIVDTWEQPLGQEGNPTPEQIQSKLNIEAKDYLAETDWYVIRYTETGVGIPEDIKAKRQIARDSII